MNKGSFLFWNVMQSSLVVGNRWFGVTCFYPSSSTVQSKNSGNRWRRYFTWDSGDWSIGNVREPVMLLEHAVATRTKGKMKWRGRLAALAQWKKWRNERGKRATRIWWGQKVKKTKEEVELTTGVDYAGPISIRLGTPHSKMMIKGYIAIFVCFVTKAVHIEVVTSLTTEAFLAALRRFISRQGRPRTIYSDNGTNFQGAANQLHDLYKMLQSSSQMATVQDFFATEGCDWKFIPPHGPHFGGLWEAAVKSMKHHLRRTLGSHIATYEELCTLLAEIEACLNSRPLCALSSDPFNPTYLSPGHFLIGEPLTQLPSTDYTDVKCNRLSSSGNDGHPTIFRICSGVNAGRGHFPTCNQVTLYCWRKTTRYHTIGLQLSSLRPIQGKMASSVL